MGETILDFIEANAHLKRCVSERDAEIARLRQQVAESERQWDNVRHDNAKLLRQLTENRHAYKRLHDDMEDVNRHNAELRQQVAELQAWKANVPVKALNRMMTVAPFDSVEADIVWKWLKFSR